MGDNHAPEQPCVPRGSGDVAPGAEQGEGCWKQANSDVLRIISLSLARMGGVLSFRMKSGASKLGHRPGNSGVSGEHSGERIAVDVAAGENGGNFQSAQPVALLGDRGDCGRARAFRDVVGAFE